MDNILYGITEENIINCIDYLEAADNDGNFCRYVLVVGSRTPHINESSFVHNMVDIYNDQYDYDTQNWVYYYKKRVAIHYITAETINFEYWSPCYDVVVFSENLDPKYYEICSGFIVNSDVENFRANPMHEVGTDELFDILGI